MDQFLGTFTKNCVTEILCHFVSTFKWTTLLENWRKVLLSICSKKRIRQKNIPPYHIFRNWANRDTGCTVFIFVSWTFDRKIIGWLHCNCLWSCDFYLRAFSKWCLSCLTEKNCIVQKNLRPQGYFNKLVLTNYGRIGRESRNNYDLAGNLTNCNKKMFYSVDKIRLSAWRDLPIKPKIPCTSYPQISFMWLEKYVEMQFEIGGSRRPWTQNYLSGEQKIFNENCFSSPFHCCPE